jgi:hypothetical protein
MRKKKSRAHLNALSSRAFFVSIKERTENNKERKRQRQSHRSKEAKSSPREGERIVMRGGECESGNRSLACEAVNSVIPRR